MTLLLPKPVQAVLASAGKHFSLQWYQFLRGLAAEVGLIPDQVRYQPMFADAHRMNLTGATLGTITLSGALEALGFPAGTDEHIAFGFMLPNNYREGTDIKVFALWAPDSTNTGNAVWELETEFKGNGDTYSSTTKVTSTSAAGGTASKRQQEDFTDISGTGAEKGDFMMARVGRLGSDAADTFTGNGSLLGVGLKYQIDGVGTVLAHP